MNRHISHLQSLPTAAQPQKKFRSNQQCCVIILQLFVFRVREAMILESLPFTLRTKVLSIIV